MSWRLFLAAPVPDELRATLARWARETAGADRGWRCIAPGSIHLTLRFYGDTEPARVPDLAARGRELARAHAPLSLDVAGWGAFPGPARPRVLWVGLAGQVEELRALAAAAEQDARTLGFEPEQRPFRAHLTVARVARRGERVRPPGAPDAGAPSFGALRIEELVLYRSHLEPDGARYEALERFPLGAARGA